MYSEYRTDIELLCQKADLTESEKEAVVSFALANCDKLQAKAEEDEALQKAFRKMINNNLYGKFKECIKTPKSWDTDFDGENGIPN